MIIRLHRSGGCELICDVPKCFALLSAMPGRKKWLDRKLIFQPSGANIEFITNTWPDAQWIDGADEHREKWLAIKMQEQNTREDKKEQLQDDSGYIYKTVPFIHQKQAFLLGKDKKGFAWFHEQGCGKTKVALDVFAYRFEQNLVDALLIVAPNGVHANWIINEVPAHLPDRLRTECYVYSAGMKRAEAEAIHKASHCPVKRKCIIAAFNVEGFVSEKAQSLFDNFLANHRCMVVVDESSTIQNPSAKRTKYIIKAGRKAVYKCILNGTPITRGIENVYSQFKFLDPLILGHDSFYTFRAQYCIMGGFEFKQIVGYKHIQ